MEEKVLKYKNIIVLVILVVSLLAVSAVSAADNATSDVFGVEETTDEVVSVEENQVIEQTDSDDIIGVDNGTFTALQNKINNAAEGSTITLENDYTYDEDFKVIGIFIDKPLTIDGNGHTINALEKSRIFLIEGENVVLKNIKFCNANDQDYGNDNGGGAIKWKGSNGVLSGCSFDNSNTPDYGGAVFWLGDNGVLSDCSFADSNAYYGGGAVCWFGSSGVLSGCSFVDSNAKSNSYNGDGGAVCWSGDNGVLRNCSFVDSSAHVGGAVDWDGANGILSDCNFFNSLAFKNRQGNYIGEGCDVHWSGSDGILRDCNFSNAFSKEAAGDVYWGGSNGVLSGCSFMNSYVYDGGAICWAGNNGNLTDCSFVNCSTYANWYGGSAVYWSASSGDLHGCSFVDCSAKYGGAVYWDGTNGALSDCSFVDCSAIYRGGAVYWTRDNGVLSDCNFVDCYSNGFEDAVYWSGDDGKIIYCSYTKNGSKSNGLVISGENVVVIEPVKINVKDVTKYCGGSEKLIVELTKDNEALSNVNVKITVNGKTSTVTTDSNGQANLDLNLPVGTYDVVTECGDVKVTSKVTVKSTITVADAAGVYSNSKVTATFLNTAGKALASRQITFKIGTSSYSATTNANGVATANVPLGVGTYTVTAVNPANNEQKTFKLIISKADSKIALTSTQSNGVTTLTATLTPTSASGNVVFNVNGENRNVQINNGKATLTLKDLEPGNYTVTASYNGDKNLNASTSNAVTFSIAEVYPILTAKDLTKTYGTSNKFVVNLVDSKGNAIPNAVVNVDIKGKITPITTGSNGQATMVIGLAPGEYTANATYGSAARATAKITVKKATPKLTAKAKTFKKSVKTKKYTITLKTNTNKVMKNTKVTLKVNGKTYKATTNTKGQATFKITKLTKKGKFTATIKYAGSKYYNAKTVKAKITVK